jgi:glutathione S-transferase
MESGKIVKAIEKKFPSPTVHLDSPIVHRVDSLVDKCMPTMHPNLLYKFSQVVLSEEGYDYWVGKYTAKLGMPLDEYERLLGGEKSWSAALPFLTELTSLLKERQAEGPFFLGKDISYADFIWAGALVFVRRIDGNVYQELLDRTGARDVHERFLEACAPWMKRDSY